MPRSHVMGPQTNPHLIVPNADRMIPKATAPGWRIGNLVDVVDQHIDLADFIFDSCKESSDLRIITMINLHCDTFATRIIDHLHCGVNRQWSTSGTAPRDVHRGTFFGQGDCSSSSNATT